MENELLTPAQWSRKCNITILDADGWNSGTPALLPQSLNKPLTKTEFDDRLTHSTVSAGKCHYKCQPGVFSVILALIMFGVTAIGTTFVFV